MIFGTWKNGGRASALGSIDTYRYFPTFEYKYIGGTEMLVFRKCVASMTERVVRIISIIKKVIIRADIGTSFRLSPPVITNLIEFNQIL